VPFSGRIAGRGALPALLLSLAFLSVSLTAEARTDRLAALDGDAAAGAGALDAPWSAVVRDIQRELKDLGLYDGPVDGRYDARVKSAIQRFEAQHGEIGEGVPLSTALRRIVSVRDGLELRRALDRIRERQTERARQALLGSPATRDLIDGTAGSGAPAAGSVRPPSSEDRRATTRAPIAFCGAGVSVDCLLAEARSAAERIEQANFQDWALRDIILTEVRTGRDRAVRDRLRRLSDPRLVLVAMREVAEALAEAGKTDEALALAETVPDAENRIRAIASIAVSAAKDRHIPRARELAERVVAMLQQEHMLAARVAIATTLASGLAQNGDIEGATYVIAAARNFASPATARLIENAEAGMITGALAENGEFGAAVDALTALVEASSSAMIAASASAVSRAAAAEGDRYRVATLCNLAVVQAKAGKADAAAATLRKADGAAGRLRKGYPQDYARFSIALAWAQVGDLATAEAALDALDNAGLQAEGYWRVAEIAGLAGNAGQAEGFERRALDIAVGMESRFDRAMMLGDMAIAAARADRAAAAQRIFDEALIAGRGLDAGWWRARALARLATALHAMTVNLPQ
jgi:peptidoglycan hydrolase-like protein with peptidoglycan-binding domain